MTLEEIFHAYEFNLRHGFVNNADKYREQIIAALRAGQDMRDDLDRFHQYTPACKAWDASLSANETSKGDDK